MSISSPHSPSHSFRLLILTCLLALLAVSALLMPQPALAVRVLVVVNDTPITDFDVRQRVKLYEVLGMRGSRSILRKRALQALVDDAVLQTEARRLGLQVDEIQVENAIRNMARNMGGMEKLRQTLKRKGLSLGHLRDYVRTQLLFRAVIGRSGRNLNAKVSDEEVERRLRKIMSSARLKPITVWRLRKVDLPVDDVSPVMRRQLMMARAVEAQQIMRRYSGCNSLKKAAAGIFNVRISKVLDADPGRLPAPLKKALKEAGTRKLVGPIATPKSVQLLAFCGSRTIRPKVPDRARLKERLRAVIRQEKLSQQVENLMKPLRRKAVIEWRTKRSS